MTEPEVSWVDDDPWAGMVDELGAPFDIEPAEQVAAEAVAAGAKNAPLFNLPEEFWGAREVFKAVRRQARADGTSPDAVLGAVLARASAMCSPELKFDSGGKIGGLNLFANIVAPSGIGKTEAMRSAQRLIQPPTHLTDMHGEVDQEKFRDGWALGSGEGMAEAYMGMVERDTGEVYTYGKQKGEPKTKSVKAQVRHNVFLFLDEGEALVKMMRERRGATVGQAIRTMWTGMGTGAANASETTTRHLPDGSYALGLLIGWQPEPAQALISDVSGGTPQRFVWVSGVDPEMPEEPETRPERMRLPLCDGHGHPVTGTIHFPREIKRALRARLRAKHIDDTAIVDDLNSHEPLMRCKIAALLCVLDGRMEVSKDDWRLAGMIWQTSCAVRDRLVQFGRQKIAAEEDARRERLVLDVQATEAARLRVTADVERVAKRIHGFVTEAIEADLTLKRWVVKKNRMGRDKPLFDAALTYARGVGWIADEETDGCLNLGHSRPHKAGYG